MVKAKTKRRGDGEATREVILNEAERLFAYYGYDGVSVRKITSEAKVDTALINYHFGTKEQLFREVLIRRVEKMGTEREARLEQIDLIPRDPQSLRQVLEAFVSPFIGKDEEEIAELSNYRRLIALVANSKSWQKFIFKDYYDETARQFINAISVILPDVPKKDLFWAFSNFLGSMVMAFSETGRIDNLSDGLVKSNDLLEAQEQILNYSVAGFFGLPTEGDVE